VGAGARQHITGDECEEHGATGRNADGLLRGAGMALAQVFENNSHLRTLRMDIG
jgi:hypothetical protein